MPRATAAAQVVPVGAVAAREPEPSAPAAGPAAPLGAAVVRALAALRSAAEAQGGLERLAAELRSALVARDAAGILGLAAAQERGVAALTAAGAEVGAALGALWGMLGATEAVSVVGLEAALAAAGLAGMAPALAAAWGEAAEGALRVRRANLANAPLIRQGLAYTGFALRCLTAGGAPEDSGYTPVGLPRPSGACRLIDTTA